MSRPDNKAETLRQLFKARYVVGFRDGKHHVIRDGAVLVEGNRISYVGKAGEFTGEAHKTLDLGNQMISPGFVNVHAHIYNSTLSKSLLEDAGSRALYMSSLYEYLPICSVGPEEGRASARYSLIELLRSGVTTLVEMSASAPDMLDIYQEFGVRTVIAPSYRSGAWYTDDGKQVKYRWDEDGGMEGLSRNVELIRRYSDTEGMITAMLAPAQIDTCSLDLLRETRKMADQLGSRIQIHAAQSFSEVQEILARHGLTPIELLDQVGLLGPDLIISHCILTSEDPRSNLAHTQDFDLLAASGAHIAHCPWVFGRRGKMLHSFWSHRKAGINIGLGTDTFPQDMVEEMKWAAVLSRAADQNPLRPTLADVFEAATLGGARALGREDIGRIAVGAKADLVFIDCDHPKMRPVRDPIKNLIYTAGSDPIDRVMIDGRFVVEEGKVVGIDQELVSAQIQEVAEKMWSLVPQRDWAGRTVDEVSPPTFPWS